MVYVYIYTCISQAVNHPAPPNDGWIFWNMCCLRCEFKNALTWSNNYSAYLQLIFQIAGEVELFTFPKNEFDTPKSNLFEVAFADWLSFTNLTY